MRVASKRIERERKFEINRQTDSKSESRQLKAGAQQANISAGHLTSTGEKERGRERGNLNLDFI